MTQNDEPRAARPGPDREPVPYVDDRWTKIFVAAVIVVFALIFANAIFMGKGGLLTATPSPSPAPIVTESPSASPSASPAATAAATSSPTAAATAGATPTAGPGTTP